MKILTFLFLGGYFILLAEKTTIKIIPIKGVINPVTERFVLNHLKELESKFPNTYVVLEIDTPGGLVKSTEEIVKTLLNTNLVTIAYIAPQGAKAASAGVFITIASDIIGMAPATSIGAAHPVAIGPGVSKKQIEKAVESLCAFAKSIARQKNRDVNWVISTIKKNVSLTEEEAKKKKICDFIIRDYNELCEKLNNYKLKKKERKIILKTKYASVERIEMNFREKFLHALADPNIAYIFLMIGIYALIYECATAGIGLGLALGSVCLILAFLGLAALPINLAGLLLLLLGIILLLLELKIQSGGILTAGGLSSLLLGSLVLIDALEAVYVNISLGLILGVILTTAGFFIFALVFVIKAHRKKPTTGIVGMLEEIGEAISDIDQKEGMVFVRGEYWKAISEQPIKKGEKIKVKKVDHMTLIVERC